jgi:parallel beta-helix repeat protein
VKIKENDISYNKYGLDISNSISPKINYNNIFKNTRCGVLLAGSLSIYNLTNNWWGTRFGPGGRFSILKQRVIFSDDGRIKINIKSIPFRYLSCYPWEKQMI